MVSIYYYFFVLQRIPKKVKKEATQMAASPRNTKKAPAAAPFTALLETEYISASILA